jgi:DNA-binding CsgD family transcriptional regulator
LQTDDSRDNKAIAMITKLVSNDSNNNSFKLPYTVFLEDTKYMAILTRHERERLVIELYNQGKTYREISKEARISPRDIGVIVNKALEMTEGSKEEVIKQQDNIDTENNQNQEQQLSLAAQAYKLFSEGKTPLEVAVKLNLRESEATKFCREYWKLKQLHNLNMVYEEIKDEIASFLKLYKLAKAKSMGVQQVVNVLEIADNNLPAIEGRYKRLRIDVGMLQSQKHTCKRNLYQLNNQIAATTRILTSFRISCGRERREIENQDGISDR